MSDALPPTTEAGSVMPQVSKAMVKHAKLRRDRAIWDNTLQEIKDFIRPDTTDFNRGKTLPGDSRRKIFDGTAPWALDQLASGVHSNVTSPVDRWFGLVLADIPWQSIPYKGQLWLEQVSDIIYAQYSNPFSSFAPSIHELYMELCSFGTGVIYQYMNMKNMTLTFRAYPLAQCYIEESADGVVNRTHREMKWTRTQCEDEFGTLPPKMSKCSPDDILTVIHAVYERTTPGTSFSDSKRWASLWYCEGTSELIEESGYDYFPYHAPRWTKTAGETYGRGPGLSVLPEVRMVNAMSKTLIVSAQKLSDPALQVPDDGFLLPLKTMPGGLNFKRPGTEEIIAMPTGAKIEVGVDMIEQRRDMIRRGFYVDWLVRPTKKERQTAQEINDDRNQMLSMLGPVIGRTQAELLGPMLRLSFHELQKYQMLPPMPAEIRGTKLDVAYLSPAARAQSTVRGQGLQSWIQQLTPLVQIFPEVLDSVDTAAIAPELADLNDVPRRVILSPADTAAKKKQREQAQQAQQTAAAAPQVGAAAKDLSIAKQNGLNIPGLNSS